MQIDQVYKSEVLVKGSLPELVVELAVNGNNANSNAVVELPEAIISNFSKLRVVRTVTASGYAIKTITLVTSSTNAIAKQDSTVLTSLDNISLNTEISLSQYESSYLNYVGVRISCAQGQWGSVEITFYN